MTSRDSLGWRAKFAVIVPSTNTSVQPEYDAMRPPGVTNHISRIAIPDSPVTDNASFLALIDNIRAATNAAIDIAMTMDPDDVILGMSAETFWDGAEGSDRMLGALQARTGRKVVMASHAVNEALRRFGQIRRIAIITPYLPVGDMQVRRFFEDCGYDVLALNGLKCPSPTRIAHESEQALKRAIQAVDDKQVEAIVQVGTNLAFARVAAMAETWLEKPVIAINTATWWWALRSNGIEDRLPGHGRLLEDF